MDNPTNMRVIISKLPYKIRERRRSTAFNIQERRALMNQLNMRGRRTEILLQTMGQEKTVQSYMLSDLEVCGLEESDFIELPNVFSQKDIPVKRENIPLQEDVDRWPYLEEV
ncbi:hypothetical protein AAFF_G00334490 [Aldrovandia affinis]|uniref:Uncharacterized protein n=1 Tax=Aldrovandia affinis TaxID=143900 RepID=A0AAD7SN62_9TELE|nr:hypothetical protein AAFF_G00334490 [Aldrovandia affinis]